MFSWGRMKPSATWCMVWFPSRTGSNDWTGKEEHKAVPKNKEKVKKKRKKQKNTKTKKKNAVINQKGGKPAPYGISLLSIWILQLLSKRPVCTNETCDFVIPTLYFLEPSLVVFLSAKILWSGGLPPQMDTVFGLFFLSSLVVPHSFLWCPCSGVVSLLMKSCIDMATCTQRIFDGQHSPSLLSYPFPSLTLCPFLIVASH